MKHQRLLLLLLAGTAFPVLQGCNIKWQVVQDPYPHFHLIERRAQFQYSQIDAAVQGRQISPPIAQALSDNVGIVSRLAVDYRNNSENQTLDLTVPQTRLLEALLNDNAQALNDAIQRPRQWEDAFRGDWNFNFDYRPDRLLYAAYVQYRLEKQAADVEDALGQESLSQAQADDLRERISVIRGLASAYFVRDSGLDLDRDQMERLSEMADDNVRYIRFHSLYRRHGRWDGDHFKSWGQYKKEYREPAPSGGAGMPAGAKRYWDGRPVHAVLPPAPTFTPVPERRPLWGGGNGQGQMGNQEGNGRAPEPAGRNDLTRGRQEHPDNGNGNGFSAGGNGGAPEPAGRNDFNQGRQEHPDNGNGNGRSADGNGKSPEPAGGNGQGQGVQEHPDNGNGNGHSAGGNGKGPGPAGGNGPVQGVQEHPGNGNENGPSRAGNPGGDHGVKSNAPGPSGWNPTARQEENRKANGPRNGEGRPPAWNGRGKEAASQGGALLKPGDLNKRFQDLERRMRQDGRFLKGKDRADLEDKTRTFREELKRSLSGNRGKGLTQEQADQLSKQLDEMEKGLPADKPEGRPGRDR